MASKAPSQEVALIARGVHMEYRSLAERKMNGIRDRIGGATYTRQMRIHAVRGISLSLTRGETLGLVGHNGSGKSTLLRGLAGLHPLKKGSVHAAARPKLLGINAALNKKVSGRRNLILGCLAQGLTVTEAKRRLPELVEFTGLGEFIDLPMGAYSTGMRTRLAFTVATVLTPEILFMDEAMAGGDRDFKDRARKRLREIQDNSGAIVLVSHNLNTVDALCRRALWIEQGRIIKRGTATSVIDAYSRETSTPIGGAMRRGRRGRGPRQFDGADTDGDDTTEHAPPTKDAAPTRTDKQRARARRRARAERLPDPPPLDEILEDAPMAEPRPEPAGATAPTRMLFDHEAPPDPPSYDEDLLPDPPFDFESGPAAGSRISGAHAELQERADEVEAATTSRFGRKRRGRDRSGDSMELEEF